MGETTIQLSTLLDSLLQKAYHDLTVLAELLPRKTDVDRKLEIVQYARQARQLLIRLLALVKWAKNSDPVSKCAEVSGQLRHQSWVYVDSADQLVELARNTLQKAVMPNFSLAPAIDVLTTGCYPRLPTCIQDRIIPPPVLSAKEVAEAHQMLEGVIRHRLSHEHLLPVVKVSSIRQGRVVLTVPYEFEVTLTIVGDDPLLPWRLLNVEILVGQAFPSSPVLMHEQQRAYIHQLVQSRLCAEDGTLADLYSTLHYFCLALQLDCLHAQAEKMSVSICGTYIKVDEYVAGQHMKVAYWRASGNSQSLSAFLLTDAKAAWPKVVIAVDPSSTDRPFVASHHPPLPSGSSATLDCSKLSLEDLLCSCIRLRSVALLKELASSLDGTVWGRRVKLCETPPSLTVDLGYQLLFFTVDIRVGHVLASLPGDGVPSGGTLARMLEFLEKAVVTAREQVPNLLGVLQCEVFLHHIAGLARDWGLPTARSLPFIRNPFRPGPSTRLYVGVGARTYLAVSATWTDGCLRDIYHLLEVERATLIADSGMVPPMFLQVNSSVEIDPERALQQITGTITVRCCNVGLKRKLQHGSVAVPSAKRVCLFSPSAGSIMNMFPGLLDTEMRLAALLDSLKQAGITTISTSHSELGAPYVSVFSIPCGESKGQHLLSSLLLSCQLWPHRFGTHCKMLFCSIMGAKDHVVLHRTISTETDVGSLLLDDWRDKAVLLSLTLELRAYLGSAVSPLSRLCSIRSYNYEELKLSYGNNMLVISAQGEGLGLLCPAPSPHQSLASTLQDFLCRTLSLPLLAQGLCMTQESVAELMTFVSNSANFHLIGVDPSHLQLCWNNIICLEMYLFTEGEIAFSGVSYLKPSSMSVMTQPTFLWILQSFLMLHLTGSLSVDLFPDPSPSMAGGGAPLTPSLKPALTPSPHPIASPYVAPLPSLPSLPPPRSAASMDTNSLPLQAQWEHTISLQQLKDLLHNRTSMGVSPLEGFLGSLGLLANFVKMAQQDKYLQQQHFQFVSVTRGVFTYKSETLTFSLGMDTSTMTSLKLTVKSTPENPSLQHLMDFFQAEVARPPYSTVAFTAFSRLLWLPPALFQSCLQLLQLHLHPSPETQWKVKVCLVVPDGVELGDVTLPGDAGIIYRAKLLLFLMLVQQQPGEGEPQEMTIPILHDTKSNNTYVARQSSVPRAKSSPVIQLVEVALRKTCQEIAAHKCSLFPCVRALLDLRLPTPERV